MRLAGIWFIIMALMLGLFATAPTPAQALQGPPATTESQTSSQQGFLAMTTPASCPPGGCAAGQTLGFKLDFSMSQQDPTPNPNAKVCIYAPEGWVDTESVSFSTKSLSLNVDFVAANDCAEIDASPPGSETQPYEPVIQRQTQYTSGGIFDAVEFGFRISPTATGTGTIVARVFELKSDGVWQAATNVFIPSLPVVPPTSPSYVASLPAQCGSAQPCYVDSAGDLDTGLGTGLKDAADAVPLPTGSEDPAVVRILGTYSVKTRTVEINRPIIIEGQDNAQLTFTGTNQCADLGALLSLNHGVTLRNLTINDGACTAPNRVLVKIDRAASVTEAAPVLIEGNTLSGGDNAIVVSNTAGPLTVRYNHINGNAGYALFWDSDSAEALQMVANNLHGNAANEVVDCAVRKGDANPISNRIVNHNYWGPGFTAGRVPHCTVDANKRLYAPIIRKTDQPGVNAAQIPVTDNKVPLEDFPGLSVKRTNHNQEYPLYVVDHGDPIAQGLTFTEALPNSPHPCSNLYDIFLPEGATPGGTLELYLKYDQNSVCDELISSSQFCGQTTDKAKYPLYWWYPPNASWYTTRFNIPDVSQGQDTECSTGDKEIRVMIDEDGKPGLDSDLLYTPFMVGLPLLKTSSVTAGDLRVTLTWSTTAEPEITGFVVQSREDSESSFTDVSAIINHTGGPRISGSYSYTDISVANDVKYHYRLKLIRSDGLLFYYTLGSATPQEPPGVTRTPTRTPTRTQTVTPTRTSIYNPTRTRTPTRILTIIPTRNLSATPDRTQTLTNTPFMLATRTDLAVPVLTESPTPTAVTVTPRTPTPTRRVTRTPAVTLALTAVSPAAAGGVPGWASLLLGLVAGTLSIAAAAYWWFYRPRS